MMFKENKILKGALKSSLLCNKICWLTVFVLLIFNLSGVTTGAEIQTKSYALPFYVDFDHYVWSSLYLTCDVKEYNKPFNEFVDDETEARELTFSNLVYAIRQENLSSCLDLTYKSPSMKEDEIQRHNEQVGKMMMLCKTVLFDDSLVGSNLQKLKIVNQFYLGKGGLFVYGYEGTSEPVRTVIRFKTSPGGTFYWDWEVKQCILPSIIAEMMHQMAKNPEESSQTKNETLNYKIAVTNPSEGHTANLEFNGKKYDFDVFNDTVDPCDGIASFFQSKYTLLKKGLRESVPELYTDKSREKYVDWLKNGDPNYLDSHFNNILTVKRKVRFILDADPVYIVFCQKGNKTSNLVHEYIIRDSQTNKLKFTHFYCGGFLNQLISTAEFRKSLLKDIIAAGN